MSSGVRECYSLEVKGKNLFLTPIVRKLENLSAEGSRSGAVPLVGGRSVRWVIPKTLLLASVSTSLHT